MKISEYTRKIKDSLKDGSDYLKNEYDNHELLFKSPLKYSGRRIISKLKLTPNLGLSILGVRGAGKSCLYLYLKQCCRHKNNSYLFPRDYDLPPSTIVDKIDKLKIETKEGYTITIDEGQDVTGDRISGFYKGAVENSNVIIYLIPSDKYEVDSEDIRKKILAQLYLLYIFILAKETNLKNEIDQLKNKMEQEKEKTGEDKKKLDTFKSRLKLGTHIFIIPTRKDKTPTMTDKDIRKDIYDSVIKDEKFHDFLFGRDAKVEFLDMIEMVKDNKLNLKPLDEMRHKLFGYIVEIIKKQKPYYI